MRGRVRIVKQSTDPKQPHLYRININQNHSLAAHSSRLSLTNWATSISVIWEMTPKEK